MQGGAAPVDPGRKQASATGDHSGYVDNLFSLGLALDRRAEQGNLPDNFDVFLFGLRRKIPVAAFLDQGVESIIGSVKLLLCCFWRQIGSSAFQFKRNLFRFRHWIGPRVEGRGACPRIVCRVARNDCQAVMQAGRGDDEIGLGKGMACFSTILNQQPPFEHDIFADRQNPAFKHGQHLVRQPVIHIDAASDVRYEFDAEANFGERYDTDKEGVERLRRDELCDFRL